MLSGTLHTSADGRVYDITSICVGNLRNAMARRCTTSAAVTACSKGRYTAVTQQQSRMNVSRSDVVVGLLQSTTSHAHSPSATRIRRLKTFCYSARDMLRLCKPPLREGCASLLLGARPAIRRTCHSRPADQARPPAAAATQPWRTARARPSQTMKTWKKLQVHQTSPQQAEATCCGSIAALRSTLGYQW